jgi:hypothetical protein
MARLLELVQVAIVHVYSFETCSASEDASALLVVIVVDLAAGVALVKNL